MFLVGQKCYTFSTNFLVLSVCLSTCLSVSLSVSLSRPFCLSLSLLCLSLSVCMSLFSSLFLTCPPESKLISACSSAFLCELLQRLSPLPALDMDDEVGAAFVFTCGDEETSTVSSESHCLAQENNVQ